MRVDRGCASGGLQTRSARLFTRSAVYPLGCLPARLFALLAVCSAGLSGCSAVSLGCLAARLVALSAVYLLGCLLCSLFTRSALCSLFPALLLACAAALELLRFGKPGALWHGKALVGRPSWGGPHG